MYRILVADGMNNDQIENLRNLGFDVIDKFYDGEELGLIGCLIIISLFIIFIWRGVRIAIKAKDTYGKLLAMGITSIIAVQAIINIAVVTGSMPVTGVPMPFISYGGTSLVINLTAMGILLNISRQIESDVR